MTLLKLFRPGQAVPCRRPSAVAPPPNLRPVSPRPQAGGAEVPAAELRAEAERREAGDRAELERRRAKWAAGGFVWGTKD